MVGNIQLQHISEAPEESFVDVFNEVGGKHDDTRKPLNVVQQHSHIHVGIAISRSPGLSNKFGTLHILLVQYTSYAPNTAHSICS